MNALTFFSLGALFWLSGYLIGRFMGFREACRIVERRIADRDRTDNP